MKWYKFLIYFSYFAGALLSASHAVKYLTGSIYTSQGCSQAEVDLLYSTYGSLKTLDVLYGLACIGSAVLAIITRYKLKRFHRTAPTFVIALPIFSTFCSSMYSILSYHIVNLDVSETLPQIFNVLIGAVIFILLNYIYFDKRRSLFTNE